jgi:Ca-activated chloride channel family protein
MLQLLSPKALWLGMLPLALLVYFILRRRSSRLKTLLPLSPPSLLRAASRRTRLIFRLIFAASVIALLIVTVVIAQPIRVQSWTKKWTEGMDIVISLDVSESMDATDFLPSRILVAKAVIRDFIKHRSDDRIGLNIFGGEAMTKCPLTRDYDFLLSQVDDVRLRELKQGTAIGMGLSNAIGRLRHSDSKNRIIILLTDGDSNVGSINPITAAHLAHQEGIRIYSIGIGKADRVVVPIYAYDIYGKRTQLIAQVPSYLNPELLREISRLTGGKAYMARDPGMLNQIIHEIDRLEKTKVKITPMQKREDMSYYFGVAALLLLGMVYGLQETRFRKARQNALAA